MSLPDQCPSTKGAKSPSRARRDLPRVNGRAYWRSLEEYSDTPEFRDFLEREFPAGASELLETSRRTFLQLMAASFALAGAATIPGCRRPDHKIMPYSDIVPEQVVPGRPLFYATSMPLPGGGAEGLLVETHEGRPTKIEGNPFHPNNRGRSSVWAQAAILGLYDPDRLKYPRFGAPGADVELAPTLADFAIWSREHFARFDAARGAGLAFLLEKKSSPTRDAVRDTVLRRWPQARWVEYDAAERATPAAGADIAFGSPARDVLRLERARIILSLDRDFLDLAEPAHLQHQREFAATRRVLTTADAMSRLYIVESMYSTTGSMADHRLPLAPSRIGAFAVLLARALLAKPGLVNSGPLAQAVKDVEVPPGDDIPAEFIQAVADDLFAEDDGHGHTRIRQGETLIVAGPSQPAQVHALVHALNGVLGNIGRTISFMSSDVEPGRPSTRRLADLAAEIEGGRVGTLVVLGVNPVYDAPGELDFARTYQRPGLTTLCWSVEATETAAASTWSLNGAHFLESWGDTRSWDGTIAPVQPMIAPLYEPSLSDIEFLSLLAAPPDEGLPSGYDIVRAAWASMLGLGEQDFERTWRRALHDGILPDSAMGPQELPVSFNAVARAVGELRLSGPPTRAAMDCLFLPGMLYDGRFANHGWLQELPQVATRVVWDNPALISPATAKALGLVPDDYTSKRFPEGRMARITVGGGGGVGEAGGRTIEMAVWIVPGMADNTIGLKLGYGRTVSGRVGTGVGFNTFDIRPLGEAAHGHAAGAVVEATGANYFIASTQQHWSLEGRTSLVRVADLPIWREHGDEEHPAEPDRLYGTRKQLAFGERIHHGELTHTPPNINIYPNPHYGTREREALPGHAFAKPPQWGMSIDLATCTGCGTCTIACQAENNIPIVGKKEVQKGREMHWIRVDRYFAGDPFSDRQLDMLHQPVPCMHCDNAPCETVCPVNATSQNPDGINLQVYNRCIGTRYCENNCPYKVRRFNFFDYAVTRFNGEYLGKESLQAVVPTPGEGRAGITGSDAHNSINPNLIPPRLREKLDEVSRMRMNPDVTVRSRGVMEKCTYCIQRLNEARVEMKLRDLQGVPDGFVKTACQQACPAGAIVFGDILDPASAVRRMRDHPRTYQLLGYLNTRPRTTYLVGLKNPNPRIRPVEDPFHHGDGGGDGGHDAHDGRADGHARVDGLSRSAFLRDAAKSAADTGYALSLRVLGALS